jgi:hypothetical protein
MKPAYLVAEGELDIKLLQRLLPAEIVAQTEFVAAGGAYAARSMAGTLLAERMRPVALVVDSDTQDEQSVREKRETIVSLLRQASASTPFEVFMAVPSVEAVLFQDQSILKNVVESILPETEWQPAQSSPHQFMEIVHRLNKKQLLSESLENLKTEQFQILRQNPLLTELGHFLTNVVQQVA